MKTSEKLLSSEIMKIGILSHISCILPLNMKYEDSHPKNRIGRRSIRKIDRYVVFRRRNSGTMPDQTMKNININNISFVRYTLENSLTTTDFLGTS